MREIEKLEEMRGEVRDGDLVIFDIDETLVQPKSDAFHMKNVRRHMGLVKEAMAKYGGNFVLARVVAGYDDMLVEEGTVAFVRSLPGKKLAFTALCAERKECEARIARLEKMGFSFRKDFPEEKEFVALEGRPFIKHGVLFSMGERRKGEVFKVFLDTLDKKPKRIVMADDRKVNLEDVQSVFDGEFVGFHYLGSEIYPAKEVSEEEFKAELQKLLN